MQVPLLQMIESMLQVGFSPAGVLVQQGFCRWHFPGAFPPDSSMDIRSWFVDGEPFLFRQGSCLLPFSCGGESGQIFPAVKLESTVRTRACLQTPDLRTGYGHCFTARARHHWRQSDIRGKLVRKIVRIIHDTGLCRDCGGCRHRPSPADEQIKGGCQDSKTQRL